MRNRIYMPRKLWNEVREWWPDFTYFSGASETYVIIQAPNLARAEEFMTANANPNDKTYLF